MNSETNYPVVPFIYEDRPVRVILDEQNDPWWVAKDVCDVLGVANARQAVAALDDDEKQTLPFLLNTVSKTYAIRATRGNPSINIVNEPGLYTLIIRSNKPQARVFRRWITHEVLPSLRKNGVYAAAPSSREPDDGEPLDPAIPLHVWRQVREVGRGVRLSYRVKLLGLACQMNRIDQSIAPTRAGILRDYADLCLHLGAAPEPLAEDDCGVGDFVAQCCVTDPAERVQAADLYGRYAAWYRENLDEDVPSATRFGRLMGERFEKLKSQGCVQYRGLGLNLEADE